MAGRVCAGRWICRHGGQGGNSPHFCQWHKPPIKPQFRLAVYSKILVDWILHLGLKFGMRKWNVPSLPESLFLPYLAGLFDAEGSLIMSRNRRNQKKIRQIMIYSTNRRALAVISRTLSRLHIRTSILERKRRPHYDYELRMSKGEEKKWFVEKVGIFVQHPRKRRYLNSICLPEVKDARAAGRKAGTMGMRSFPNPLAK